MGDFTKIEWTGSTWNPIRGRLIADTPVPTKANPLRVLKAGTWGYHCERVSPGCSNCYACTMNGRTLPGWGTGLDYTVPNRDKVEIYLDEDELLKPMHWKAPRKIFPCSMTDLFGDFVPEEMIDRIFAVMALCPQHTFQVLTKRAKRMREYFEDGIGFRRRVCGTECNHCWAVTPGEERICNIECDCECHEEFEPFPNVWLGVSAEDQQRAGERIPELLRTPAAVRFISAEPLLGPVDLQNHPMFWNGGGKLDWVIVGGESGHGARPCDIAWVRAIVKQCAAARVPCFVKQFGTHVIDRNDAGFEGDTRKSWPMDTAWAELDKGYKGAPVRILLKDRKGGDPEWWPLDLRVRQMPQIGVGRSA